mmetsp:Transcript_252/g.619  ORF Transcript_252/g.619 Transcript_252/m.619 type:complete len:210 (+) Transcript_252:1563-2192(+)
MYDAFGMEIANRREHLAHKPTTLLLSVMLVILLIKLIKKLSTNTKFLHQIYCVMSLINLFQPHNVRMVKFTHNFYFFPKLFEASFVSNMLQFNPFECKSYASNTMLNKSDQALFPVPQHGSRCAARVNIVNINTKRMLNVYYIGTERTCCAVAGDDIFEAYLVSMSSLTIGSCVIFSLFVIVEGLVEGIVRAAIRRRRREADGTSGTSL